MSFTKFHPAQNRQFIPAKVLDLLSDVLEAIKPNFWCDGCGQLQKESFYHCANCMAANCDLCTDCVKAGKYCLVSSHKLDLVQYVAIYTARTRVALKDPGLKTFLLSAEIRDTDAKNFAILEEMWTSVIQRDELKFTLYRSDVFSPAGSATALAISKLAVDDTDISPDGVGFEGKCEHWASQLDWLDLGEDMERGLNLGLLGEHFRARSGWWLKGESAVDCAADIWRDLTAVGRFDGRFVLDLVISAGRK